jgi:hypothetical protein
MKYLGLAFALVLGSGLAGSGVTKAADINFGEVKTRFQVQHELTAKERLRPWDLDWRHTYAWQHGRSVRTEFAPRGCYITRWVETPYDRQLMELFIC